MLLYYFDAEGGMQVRIWLFRLVKGEKLREMSGYAVEEDGG